MDMGQWKAAGKSSRCNSGGCLWAGMVPGSVPGSGHDVSLPSLRSQWGYSHPAWTEKGSRPSHPPPPPLCGHRHRAAQVGPLNAPHSQEMKLGRAEGLGLLPLLLGLALEKQGCGTPAEGGKVLW